MWRKKKHLLQMIHDEFGGGENEKNLSMPCALYERYYQSCCDLNDIESSQLMWTIFHKAIDKHSHSYTSSKIVSH